jgi:hypothetical protein
VIPQAHKKHFIARDIFDFSVHTVNQKNGMRKALDGEVSQRIQDRRLCFKETYGAKLKIGENIIIP